MAISAQVSLWGLYQLDESILDGLIVPIGMDGENLKANLLLETESMEILYPSAPFLKAAITVWAAERKAVWDKLYATTVLVYDPIENYDRQENSSSTNSGGATGSTTVTGSATAYNSNAFADTGKSVSSGNNTSNSSGTYTSRVHGNIGVTTTQQMITQELELRKHDFYRIIYMDIDSILCLKIY